MNKPSREERYTEFWPGDKYTDLWPKHYKVGMWIWLLHRITGIYIIIYGVIHLWETSLVLIRADGGASFNWFYYNVGSYPFIQILDLVTMACLLFHGFNGLRIILMDLGIGIRVHKAMFWGLMAVGALVWVFFLIEAWPIIGHASLWKW